MANFTAVREVSMTPKASTSEIDSSRSTVWSSKPTIETSIVTELDVDGPPAESLL